MKKAIVLTYAPVTKAEAKLLKETDIFKIATNYSAAELKPNIRFTADDIVDKCLECDSCPVISQNYDFGKDRVINGRYLPARHTSLVSCVDYLMLKGFTHILLIATNPDSATCKMNYKGINQLKNYLYLYKYTKDGNFDIPHKTVKEFIMDEFITEEDKILGIAKPGKILLDITALTDGCLYEIKTEGKDNASIESGLIIDSLLPFDQKQKLIHGETELKYNGMIIKRLTAVIPPKDEPKEEPKEEIIEQKPKVVKKVAAKKKVKK
jgi:hypothetical protein